MGTRSITRVNTEDDKIINMYRQSDGYPSGHGMELFEFLNGFEIVNGITGSESAKAANGAGCLAAQMVTHFKFSEKMIGGIYLYPVVYTNCDQDYEYIVTVYEAKPAPAEKGSIRIDVIAGYDKRIFSGSVQEFGEFCSR